jgi:hypothetical protein
MPAGRPLKFNPERAERIINDISHCVPYALAAFGNGIHEDTLYDWINRGKRDLQAGIDSEFAKFSETLNKVQINRVRTHLDKIAQNCDRWQADAWLLERRWYKHFALSAKEIEMDERMKKIEQNMVAKDEPNDQKT